MAQGKTTTDLTVLYRELADRLGEMDRLAGEMAALGRELPVIARNTTALKSLIRALKFGICDPVDRAGA